MSASKFTKNEDELIIALYPRGAKEDLLSQIPYSWSVIVRRAAMLKTKRDLSFIHIKNRMSTGESVQDFAIQNKIPLTTANKIFKKYGEEYLKDYVQDPYVNLLELRLQKLLENTLPIERWNKYPLEADISYRPDFRIEHNDKILYINIDGVFYHTEDNVGKTYHQDLQRAFDDNNLRLLQFRSEELDDSSQIIKSIIENHFDVGQKIRGSKCEIKEVSQDIMKPFLDENHLMGGAMKRPGVGLFYKDELVSLFCFSMHSGVLEIDRFCTKINTRVYGAFSKLLKYLIALKKPSAVRSFCDLRYATGASYKSLNFQKESTTLGWRWANSVRTFNRLSCRANMDERRLSQDEYAKELGYSKLYDAGQVKYLLILDSKKYEIDKTIERPSYEPRRSMWTKLQKEYLKELFDQDLKRADIIKQFQLKYPKKTKASIIHKLSNKMTRPNKYTVAVGQTFNYWTVIDLFEEKASHIICRCICGIEKKLQKGLIKNGASKSCGCKREELCAETNMKKYGVRRASQSEEVKLKVKNKTK